MTNDETLQEQLAQALESVRIAERLQEIGAAVASERDLERLVQIATDAATELTGAQFGAFFYNVINDSGEAYTLYTISGVPREAFSKFPMPRNTPVFEPTFRATGTVRSGDITKDARYGHNAPHHGMPAGHLPVKSYLAVPVVSRNGEAFGGLFFGHAAADVFSAQHERVAEGIAGWAALAIDNGRLYSAAQREIATRQAAEENLDLALSAAGLGHWNYDIKTGEVTWDSRYRQIYGLPADMEPNFNAGIEAVHPDDRERVRAAVQRAVDTGVGFEPEMRVVLPNGDVRWVLGKGHVIHDEQGNPVRMAGVALDVTARVDEDRERRTNAERLRLALEHSGLGDWSWDAASDAVTFSAQAAEIFEIPPGPQMTWAAMRDLLHADDREIARMAVVAALETRSDYDVEYRVRRRMGGWKWIAARGRGVYDDSGTVAGMLGTVQDVSARRRSEETTRVLAEAGSIVPTGEGPEGILATYVEFAARTLADFALGYLVDMDGLIRTVTAAHADPHHHVEIQELKMAPPVAGSDHVVARVVRSAATLSLLNATPEDIVGADSNSRHLEILRSLAPTSAIVTPLFNESRVVGVLVVGRVEGGVEPFTTDVVPLIEEFGRRVGLLIENARLFHEAQTANRAKSEFLATMSHELRTPLNVMIGYADLLLLDVGGNLVKQQREYVERSKSAAWHQLGLIEGILSYSRIEAGQEEISIEEEDIAQIVSDTAELIRPLAERNGLSLDVSAPPELITMTDAAKLRQILINLLSNAIKFTETGGVSVELHAVGEDIEIAVRDTGPGIPEEKTRLIFDAFVQLDRAHTRKHGGTGLGLTISRKLAKMLGGNLSVTSENGKGSEFILTLPSIALHPRPTSAA